MMLSLPSAVRIWLATRPTDMRKSFDGLAEVVRQQLERDPLSGQLFVFRNKRGDRVKLLCWRRQLRGRGGNSARRAVGKRGMRVSTSRGRLTVRSSGDGAST